MRGKTLLLLAVGLVVGFAINSVMTSGLPWVAADCQDEPCADPPCCNGDVNGDGFLDIADPIFLCAYLFADGPEPAEIPCCLPCPPCRLPATGQARCFNDSNPVDNNGNAIDCISSNFPGQDGFYQAGCAMEGRFVDNGDDTVTDTCTELMWQQATADINGDGESDVEDDGLTWAEALRYCENLELAGYSDWRLPNVRELQSLLNYGEAFPAIDRAFSAMSGWHWSSSSLDPSANEAWYVSFIFGGVVHDSKGNPCFVIAVRGGLTQR